MSGRDLYVFKSNSDNTYYLWYLKREDGKQGVQFYDFNEDGKKDFIISKSFVSPQGQGRLYADIYMASSLVPVRESPRVSPPGVELFPNYPDPVNPFTTIAYQLPQTGYVELVVYDVLGREVAVLLKAVETAGVHRIHWDTTKISSGIYLCQLKTGKLLLTQKLLLIR
ncbi:MAG: hypothetical protein C4326_00985 [Ignavibacteria bacterium]